MTQTYPARIYQTTEAATADPKRQVVLLFDAMVRYLHYAAEAMVRSEHYEQCRNIILVQRILTVLMSALDAQAAPDLAGGLYNLYNWLHARLTEASMGDDQDILNEVTQIITGLRDAWRQADMECRAEFLERAMAG